MSQWKESGLREARFRSTYVHMYILVCTYICCHAAPCYQTALWEIWTLFLAKIKNSRTGRDVKIIFIPLGYTTTHLL